ncbi:hypothetical protein O181_010478 [Austropuccinia psidii MF-1]|uniref:Uncharacterized protein n=1 Tax=Austropuccinia psidii MF-1 TaxID=1389203 RepID=A0A9Q3BT30_9BASI|nr:hypothetical protein [Austropuccinia psidii MF-1]
MSPVHLRNLRIPRNQPEVREGFSRTRRPGRRYLGDSGGWKDIEGSCPLCHSLSNSTETPNQRTGTIWIKFFTSTNSSKIFSNGDRTTRNSTWHHTGQNLKQVARSYVSDRYRSKSLWK